MASLDELFPKEFVESRNKQYELSELQKESPTYWDFLGELQFFGDFNLVYAVLEDYLTIEQARELLYSTRKAYNSHIYDIAVATLAGNTGGDSFNKLMKNYG